MKLELKHLAPYLPYGLKCQAMGECIEGTEYDDPSAPIIFITHGLISPNKVSIRVNEKLKLIDFDEYFPILRPLSDLKKLCKDLGFIPIEAMFLPCGEREILTRWSNENKCWLGTQVSYLVYQTLFEWHFDVFGLIENNLAIDINTLEDETRRNY